MMCQIFSIFYRTPRNDPASVPSLESRDPDRELAELAALIDSGDDPEAIEHISQADGAERSERGQVLKCRAHQFL